MKKALVVAIVVFLFITSICGGCSSSSAQSRPQDVVDRVFAALDAGDKEAVCQLFSKAVQDETLNLSESVEHLLEVYTGPLERSGDNDQWGENRFLEDGKYISSMFATFPVLAGGNYYWFTLEYMYENDIDPQQIGMTRLALITADEAFLTRHDKQSHDIGVTVVAQRKAEAEIRSVNGYATAFVSTGKIVNKEEALAFFEDSNVFSEFKEVFGDPCADNEGSYIYEMPAESGQVRYLELTGYGILSSATVVDDFGYIETLYKEDT